MTGVSSPAGPYGQAGRRAGGQAQKADRQPHPYVSETLLLSTRYLIDIKTGEQVFIEAGEAQAGRSRMGRTPQDHRSGGAGWAGHHGTSRIFALCEALPPLNRPFSYPPDRLTAALAQTPAASTASGPTAAGCTTTRSLRRSAPPTTPLPPPTRHRSAFRRSVYALQTLCRRSVDAL